MKPILNFIVLCLIFNTASGQWTQKSNIPGSGAKKRMAATSFSFNDSLGFIVGGLKLSGGNYIAYNDFWKYNADDDSWTALGNFPGGNKYGNVSFVIDNIAYVGLGGNQFGTLNQEFWAYNINTATWAQIANFPGSGRVYSSAMTIGSKGYVGGGVKFISGNAVYLDDFWEYNPILNVWTQKASYLNPRAGTLAFGVGSKGYIGYGETSNSFYIDLYEYDPAVNQWVIIPAGVGMPSSAISFGAVEVVNGKAYVIGGETLDHVYTNRVWEYSPSNNSWIQRTSFSGIARRNAISFSLGSKIYYGTGQTGADETNVKNDLWEFSNITTGIISDNLQTNSLNVFPNPAKDLITIKSLGIDDIQLFDLLGQNVIGSVHFLSIEKNKLVLDVSNLTPGLYSIRTKNEVIKFVKG